MVRNWQKPLHVNGDAIRIANNALFLLGETVDSLGFLQEAKRSAVFHVSDGCNTESPQLSIAPAFSRGSSGDRHPVHGALTPSERAGSKIALCKKDERQHVELALKTI